MLRTPFIGSSFVARPSRPVDSVPSGSRRRALVLFLKCFGSILSDASVRRCLPLFLRREVIDLLRGQWEAFF